VSISLLCTHAHPALPALATGITLTLARATDGRLTVSMPSTAHFLDRVRAALKDGALALTADSTDDLKELETLIMGERDRILAQMDAMVREAQARPAQQQAG
jgi:hypothetical protein